MRKSSATSAHTCAQGITLTEYSVLLVLVGLLSLAGLKALGNATSNLFQDSKNAMETGGTLSLLDTNALNTGNNTGAGQTLANGNTNASTGATYQPAAAPVSGQPSMQLAGNVASAGTNVSSSEGMQKSLGSMVVASAIQTLADKQTNPTVKGYFQQLADLTYYLGGTEGVIDDVAGLTIDQTFQGNKTYTTDNALDDMQSYAEELAYLIKNPPAGVSKQALSQVKGLTNKSVSIANNYLESNGKSGVKGGNGKGNSGIPPGKEVKQSYDQIVPPGQIRAAAQHILNDNHVDSATVEATLGNATAIDPLASIAPAP